MNLINLIGNLGRDCEVKTTPSGKNVVNFAVATSHYANGKDETVWHNCQFWGERASKVAKYLKKGSKIAVTGSVRLSVYEKDGQKRQNYFVLVQDIELISSPREEKNYNNNNSVDFGEDIVF